MQSRRRELAKETLVNLAGWSTEYMATHVGLIVTNPLLYRAVSKFTEQYLVSPLALIGRATIWIGRGLYSVGNPEADATSARDVFIKAGDEILTMLAVEAFYNTGSKLAGHSNLLIERSFVDTFVVSATSALLIAAVQNCPSRHWPFWNRGPAQVVQRNDEVNESSPLVISIGSAHSRLSTGHS